MAKPPHRGLIIEQPVPMRKKVYEHLRGQILNRTIEPSSRLVEAQIAKDIGISRTPVREALHLLEKDGFVESIPRVGYRVKNLAWNELDEIIEIRRVNETLACRWAIQRIEAKTIKALESNLTRAQAALDKGSPDHFLEFDEEFHEILVRASGSRHLLELCQTLRRLMLRYRSESIKSSPTVTEALKGHRRILDCLKQKDEDGLVAALLAHLDYSKNDIRNQTMDAARTD
jgi:DNA-binding GntR family transcriptional regulator